MTLTPRMLLAMALLAAFLLGVGVGDWVGRADVRYLTSGNFPAGGIYLGRDDLIWDSVAHQTLGVLLHYTRVPSPSVLAQVRVLRGLPGLNPPPTAQPMPPSTTTNTTSMATTTTAVVGKAKEAGR